MWREGKEVTGEEIGVGDGEESFPSVRPSHHAGDGGVHVLAFSDKCRVGPCKPEENALRSRKDIVAYDPSF